MTRMIFSIIVIGLVAANPFASLAQTEGAQETFAKGKVIEILDLSTESKAKIRILSGEKSGQTIEAELSSLFTSPNVPPLRSGETIVMTTTPGPDGDLFFITDRYRVPSLLWIAIAFLALVLILGRRRGFSSMLGLAFSLIVLLKFILPQILAGKNPLMISLIGATIIAFCSLYLAHGFHRRTHVAVIGTLASLWIAAFLAVLAVGFSKLNGLGSEEVFLLTVGPLDGLNLRGLLLGGIMIGALGVLDDITSSQAAAIDELHAANPTLSSKELLTRGLSIGKEHIAALINTLVLAYAGASLPLLLLFLIQPNQPLWVTANSEFIAEEIIRTLIGSAALVLAVPITTMLGAYLFSRQNTRTIKPK